jgi:hypothetical protein
MCSSGVRMIWMRIAPKTFLHNLEIRVTLYS